MNFHIGILPLLFDFLILVNGKSSCKPSEKKWKCPKDDTWLSLSDVCAPPLKNKIDCPSGGDQDMDFCDKQNCTELGLFKCHKDPYCVKCEFLSCFDCPSGHRFPQFCTNGAALVLAHISLVAFTFSGWRIILTPI